LKESFEQARVMAGISADQITGAGFAKALNVHTVNWRYTAETKIY